MHVGLPHGITGIQSFRLHRDSPSARSAKKIIPAHVPQIGLPDLAKLCSSGMSPHRSATRAMVVLSPPTTERPMGQDSFNRGPIFP